MTATFIATKTMLIAIDDIPFSKMRKWEEWQIENEAQWISGFTEIEREGWETLNFKGVFESNKGQRALAALQKILGPSDDVTSTDGGDALFGGDYED